MNDELVLAQLHGPILRLTLNGPDKLKALSTAVIENLSALLAAAVAWRDARFGGL